MSEDGHSGRLSPQSGGQGAASVYDDTVVPPGGEPDTGWRSGGHRTLQGQATYRRIFWNLEAVRMPASDTTIQASEEHALR
jgi:hypothetical protein